VRNISAAFLALLLVGCQPAANPKPAQLLSQTQMASILADIHVAEAQVDHQFPSRDTARMAFSLLEKQIFAKHAVTDSLFRQSYDYYLLHLKELDQIYEGVVDTLNLRQLKAGNQKFRPGEPRREVPGPSNSSKPAVQL
jgi:hypothetical protein